MSEQITMEEVLELVSFKKHDGKWSVDTVMGNCGGIHGDVYGNVGGSVHGEVGGGVQHGVCGSVGKPITI